MNAQWRVEGEDFVITFDSGVILRIRETGNKPPNKKKVKVFVHKQIDGEEIQPKGYIGGLNYLQYSL